MDNCKQKGVVVQGRDEYVAHIDDILELIVIM